MCHDTKSKLFLGDRNLNITIWGNIETKIRLHDQILSINQHGITDLPEISY